MTDPFWPWCPALGAARTTRLAIDIAAMGDGYTQRIARGLNPARPSWDVQFPFQGQAALDEMEAFLLTNAVRGFYWTPPGSATEVLVTVDEWSNIVIDKNRTDGLIGSLQATFTRAFNPQPITPA